MPDCFEFGRGIFLRRLPRPHPFFPCQNLCKASYISRSFSDSGLEAGFSGFPKNPGFPDFFLVFRACFIYYNTNAGLLKIKSARKAGMIFWNYFILLV